MKILVVVGSEQCENHCRRKGKGSSAMQFSRGLVAPNRAPNWCFGKGKPVNIPVPLLYVRQRRLYFRRIGLVQHNLSVVLTSIDLWSVVMTRSRSKLGIVSRMRHLDDAWCP